LDGLSKPGGELRLPVFRSSFKKYLVSDFGPILGHFWAEKKVLHRTRYKRADFSNFEFHLYRNKKVSMQIAEQIAVAICMINLGVDKYGR